MSLVRKVAVNAVAAAAGRVLLVMTGVVSVGIATRRFVRSRAVAGRFLRGFRQP